ncbi:MAG: 3-hydroxyacyl-CoA dehydrogenase [Magnetospirillum sp.]
MALDSLAPNVTIGIVGTGAMGRGIAQIAAVAGCHVLLLDNRPGAAQDARDQVVAMLAKLVEKAKITAEAADHAARSLCPVREITDLRDCHLVIEAIVESMDAKQDLVRQLEAVVTSDCVIASNTSSLSVTAIAAIATHPERVAGFHFFNPVPLMKVVEVIGGVRTAPWVIDQLSALATRMGHQPVPCQDSPGFVVNHAGRGYILEALKVVGEGVADFATVDRIMRDSCGFRLGPFELMDLTGLDVTHPVMESIYRQFYDEPRYRPSPITRQRLAAGLLGRKSGCGFYDYGNKAKAGAPSAPPRSRPPSVWVAPGDGGVLVVSLLQALGINIESAAAPSDQALCLVAPLGEDCTAAALRLGLDPRRTVAVDTLPELGGHRTLMVNPLTRPDMRDAAHGLFAEDGVGVSVINDSPGFVAQRILAAIVNVGSDIAQSRIAAPRDIDHAVTLGLAYPFGPLAWGDKLGAERVLRSLNSMLALTGDPRYRPSPWLRRRAGLGISLLIAENEGNTHD